MTDIFCNNEYIMKSRWFIGDNTYKGSICVLTPEGDTCIIFTPNHWFVEETKNILMKEICDNHNAKL